MRKAILILLTTLTLAEAGELRVTGTLIRGETEQESYLAIIPEVALTETSPTGEEVTADRIQIAGLSPEAYRKAYGLLGQSVTASGEVMFPETVHHHTPFLIITETVTKIITPTKEGKKTGLEWK